MPQGRRACGGFPAARLCIPGTRGAPAHAPGARRMVHRARDLRMPGGTLDRGVLPRASRENGTRYAVGCRDARRGCRELRAVRASGGVRRQQPGPGRVLPLRGQAGANRGAAAPRPPGSCGFVVPSLSRRQEVPGFLPLRAGPRRAAVLSRPVRVSGLWQPRRRDVGQPLRRAGHGGAGRRRGVRARERGLRPVAGSPRRRAARW